MTVASQLIALVLLAPSLAAAEPAPPLELGPGQAGASAALTYDQGDERISGARLTAFFDISGIGVALSADYQTLREPIELSTFSRPSVAVGLALRLSAVSLAAAHRRPEVLRWLDVFGTAGFEGGISGTIDGVGARGSTWLGAGIELRLGALSEVGSPGLRVEYQRHGNLAPAFSLREMLMIGVSLSG